MRVANLSAVLLSGLLLSLASAADDEKDKEKNEKKAKLPPLTFVGNIDGELMHVDTHSDRLVVQITDVVPQWVQNQGFTRRFNSGTYVPKEEKKEIPVNLSPDLKVRIMYNQQTASTGNADKAKKKEKQPTPKEMAEKDPDYKLGGTPGKKGQLSKGQIVRLSIGRNNDRINPQNYVMVVYVIKESK